MTDTITIKATLNKEVIQNGRSDFGFRDQLHREVGYQWSIATVAVEEITGDSGRWGYYTLPIGHARNYFEVRGQPTRNGKGYGPSFNRVKAMTLEGAEAIVARRICAARNRDTKKFKVSA